MGSRGPKPTPTKIRKLEGWVNKNRINNNEPKFLKSKRTPPPPAFLNAVAKKEWKRVAGELHKLGLLTNLDKSALAAYCVCYATWVQATGEIKKHGVLIKAQSGFPIQSPYVSISNKAMSEMRRWLAEFGMTPSSRSKIVVQPDRNLPGAELLGSGIGKNLD